MIHTYMYVSVCVLIFYILMQGDLVCLSMFDWIALSK